MSEGHQDRDSESGEEHDRNVYVDNAKAVEESDIVTHKSTINDQVTHDSTDDSTSHPRSLWKSNGKFLSQDRDCMLNHITGQGQVIQCSTSNAKPVTGHGMHSKY